MKKQITRMAFGKKLSFLFASGLLLAGTTVQAQTQNLVRNYTSRVQASNSLLGSATATGNAVDGDPETYATISSVVLGSPDLFMDFGTSSSAGSIDGNRPITVKVTLPGGVLNAVGGVTVQAIKNLQNSGGWGATPVGSSVTESGLLGLLSGNGSMYITLTPGADYDGIKVSMSGVNAVTSMKVYEAFILDTVTTSVECGAPVDMLSGVGSAANVASITSSVTDPWDAIDGDTSTYASIETGVQVLNEAYLTPVFSQPSKAGDLIRIVLSKSGGLLNLSALTGFEIQPYLGETALTPIDNSSSLLRLRLLYPGSSKQVLTVPVSGSFDRVKISIGGVANALDNLNIYEVEHVIPMPEITSADSNIYVYAGQSATLTATTSNGDDVVWFTDSVGGTPLASNVVTTTAAQAGTVVPYYAGASRNGCTEASDRNTANVHIIGFTSNTPPDGEVQVAYNGSVAITPQSTNNLPNTPVYHYSIYAGALPNGISMDTTTGDLNGLPTTAGTYSVGIQVDDQANNLLVDTTTYSIVITDGALDVNWNYFRAEAGANHTTILTWETASEKDNSYFVVERSNDGKSFAAIDKVMSEGNAEVKQKYSYTDRNVEGNVVYYRLKQVDVNGTFSYSTVAKVTFSNLDNAPLMVVTPNPGHDFIRVQLTDNASATVISVSDLNGRVIYHAPFKGKTVQIPAAPGTYFVSVMDAKGNVLDSRKAIIK